MRPENLGFEECNVDAIYRDLDKKTQTPATNHNGSANNSIKSTKLPVPRDLDPTLVKVYSNCNKNCSDKSCETLTPPTQGIHNNKEKCRLPSKCNCSKHSSVRKVSNFISTHDNCSCSSGKSNKMPHTKENTNCTKTQLKQEENTMTLKLNIEKVPKEPIKSPDDENRSCVTVFIDKSLYEEYKDFFDQNPSEKATNDKKINSDSKCSTAIKNKCSCKELHAEQPNKHLKDTFDKIVNKVCSSMKFESNNSANNNSNCCQKETSKPLETNKISDIDKSEKNGQEECKNYVVIRKISKKDVLDLKESLDTGKSENECQDFCEKNFNKPINTNLQDKSCENNKTVKKSRSCDCSESYSKDFDKNSCHNDLNKNRSLQQFSNKCSTSSVLVKKESPRKDICVDKDVKGTNEDCQNSLSSNTFSKSGLCGKRPEIICPRRKQSFEDFCKENACKDVLKSMKENCKKLEKKCSQTKNNSKNLESKSTTCLKSPKKSADSQCSLKSSTSRDCLNVPNEKSGSKISCNENKCKNKSCKDVANDIIEDEVKGTEYLKMIQKESDKELYNEYDEYLKMETDTSLDIEKSGWSRVLSHDLAYISLKESESDLLKNTPENRSAQFHLPIPGTSPLKLNSDENIIWDNCLSILPVSGKTSRSNIEISASDTIKTNMPSECRVKISFTNPNIVKNHSDTDKSEATDFASKSLEDTFNENENSYSFISAALKNGLKSDRSYPKFVTNIKDNIKIESLTAAHSQTIATLKYAVQDIADKVYTTTADAITRIHSESSKHLDVIKNYNKSEGSEMSKEKIETFFKECINNLNEQQVRSVVSSASSLLKDTCKENLPCLNDCSSAYDVPDPNIQDVSQNSIETKTSVTSTIFWFIKNKFKTFFSKGQVENSLSSPTNVAARPSNTSNTSNLTKDIEENIDENDSISDDDN